MFDRFDTEVLDEREILAYFKEENEKCFLSYIEAYDNFISPQMRSKGYEYVARVPRTVTFCFGTITFRRRYWKRGSEKCYPVDEKLGLKKKERYSAEMICRLAELTTIMPYRKVVKVCKLMYNISISHNLVLKARKEATRLLKKQSFIPQAKKEIDILYIEGDGLMLKTSKAGQKHVNLSHFIIHTGSEEVGKNRYQLKDKKEIISASNKKSRQLVVDYIHSRYEFHEDSLIVTNSDGGQGYTPYIFKELVKSFRTRHEHFWDSYHVHKKITDISRGQSFELRNLMFEALQSHNRKLFISCLDTLESLLTSDKERDKFIDFKRNMLRNWQYTKPACLRDLGFENLTLGVIESQHRKITYRMKGQGAYWSESGADTLSNLILKEREEGSLRELFYDYESEE